MEIVFTFWYLQINTTSNAIYQERFYQEIVPKLMLTNKISVWPENHGVVGVMYFIFIFMKRYSAMSFLNPL